MKSIIKKIAIYSMVGLMQVGLGTSVIEASPRDNDSLPMHQRYDRDQDRYGDDQNQHERERMEKDRHEHERMERERHERERMERERHERERMENERHEREMQRRHHESDRDWHDRQEREKQRHDNASNEFNAGLIGFIIGLMIK